MNVDYREVLTAGQEVLGGKPLPEPTEWLPGSRKVEVFIQRLKANQSLFHPADEPLPDWRHDKKVDVRPVYQVSGNGELMYQGWQVNREFPDDTEDEPCECLPVSAIARITRNGYRVGGVGAIWWCPGCGWPWRDEHGCCRWCGKESDNGANMDGFQKTAVSSSNGHVPSNGRQGVR